VTGKELWDGREKPQETQDGERDKGFDIGRKVLPTKKTEKGGKREAEAKGEYIEIEGKLNHPVRAIVKWKAFVEKN